MKTTFLAFVIICSFLQINAQTFICRNDTSTIYQKVDKDPAFPGGFQMFESYIDNGASKILKPDHALGYVIAKFFIEKSGKITKPEILRGLTPATDSAAVYLLKNSPLWVPGVKNSLPVKTFVKIAVKFNDPKFARIVRVPDVHLSPGQTADVAIDEPVLPENNPVDPNKIFTSVEKLPEFPGGITKFLQYLKDNRRVTAPDAAYPDRVIITFVVEKDGSLTNIKVIRGLSTDCDAEAIRLIKASPKWTPGTVGDKPVRVQYPVPISFKAGS